MSIDIEESSAQLERCLAMLGTDGATLLQAVGRFVDVRNGEHVLAAGSLIENLGNEKSDLDLLYITNEDRPGDEMGWALGRRMVDLRPISRHAVVKLIDKLRVWADRPWSLLELAPFSDDERLLLHRLATGIEVPATPRESPERDWFRPNLGDISCLKLQVARHLARTIQIDMVGYRRDQDYATLVLASQELLGRGVDGLLAGFEMTNPNPKWRHRLLGRLPLDWNRRLSVWPAGVPAQTSYWKAHRAPAEPDAESSIAHALRCAALTRAAFALAEPRLVAGLSGRELPESVRTVGEYAGEGSMPALEFDVDFCFTTSGVAVARLNEFGRSVPFTDHEFALVLRCDGSVPEARMAWEIGCRDDGTRAASSVDVQATLTKAIAEGLCFEASGSGASGD